MPQDALDTIDMMHGLQEGGKRKKKGAEVVLLWPWSRTTTFRRVKEVMEVAKITDGPHKCPKGLRHGYGVHAISCGATRGDGYGVTAIRRRPTTSPCKYCRPSARVPKESIPDRSAFGQGLGDFP